MNIKQDDLFNLIFFNNKVYIVLIYGKTAVDLNSVSGSTLAAAFFGLVSFCTKEEG